MASMVFLHNNLSKEHDAILSSLVQISQHTTLINEQQITYPPHEKLDTFQQMLSTTQETTTKKSRKRTNMQNERKSVKRNKEHHQNDCDPGTPPKRLQVPRACSNCRRIHAGCGVERPCKRCMNNGLESTCFDVPRKRRSMKKENNEDGDHKSIINSPCSSPTFPMHIPAIMHIKSEGDHHRLWEDTFQELYGSGSCPSSNSSSLSSLSDIDLNAPLVFGSDQDHSGFFSSFHHEPIHQHSHHEYVHPRQSISHSHDLISHDIIPQEPHHDVPLPLGVHHNEELEFTNLLQEITNLNENNKSLESKIYTLSEELVELKKSAPSQRRHDDLSQALIESPHAAVSMWVTSFADLVLVQCDQRFVQLLGFPMHILKDNFPFSRVLENTPSDHNWPKKVQISTLTGRKDVLMTINMLTDGTTAKYFVVHVLEL